MVFETLKTALFRWFGAGVDKSTVTNSLAHSRNHNGNSQDTRLRQDLDQTTQAPFSTTHQLTSDVQSAEYGRPQSFAGESKKPVKSRPLSSGFLNASDNRFRDVNKPIIQKEHFLSATKQFQADGTIKMVSPQTQMWPRGEPPPAEPVPVRRSFVRRR